MNTQTFEQLERNGQATLNAIRELGQLQEQLFTRLLDFNKEVLTSAFGQLAENTGRALEAKDLQALAAVQSDAFQAGTRNALTRLGEAVRLAEQAREEVVAFVGKQADAVERTRAAA